MAPPPGPGIPEQSPHDVQKLINPVMKRGGVGIVSRCRAVRSWGGAVGASVVEAGTLWGEGRSLGLLSVEEWREPGGEEEPDI